VSFVLCAVNQTYVHLNRVHITMTHTLSDTQSYKPFTATTTNHQHHTASYTVSPILFIRSMDMGPCQMM
jgi:hypothetical protein